MFEQFWQRLVSRNPSINVPDQKITLTAAELKRQLKRAFTAGIVAGDFEEKEEDSIMDFLSRTFFGGKK